MSRSLLSLVYVGDPMCSWCWGFAPEIERLAEAYPVEVVVGGLRPGPSAQVLEDRMAAFLRHHWEEIAERTGQPFDTGFLERRDGWVYDTEPAAIAVAVMRRLSEADTLSYFTAIQSAFYGNGVDVTDYGELARLAARYPVAEADFSNELRADESRKEAWADFSTARAWGISGFPTLVGRLHDDRLALLARGWARADVIETRIDSLDEALAG